MEVIVNEINSRVNVSDAGAMAHPAFIERISAMLRKQLDEFRKHECDIAEERRMRPSMTSRELSIWE